MYIYLDENINNIDFSLYPQYIDSISQLISSTCCGCNLLDAKRSTFKFLINSGYFSGNQIKNLEEIMRHNYEYNDLFKNIPYKIVISSTASTISKNGSTWEIPLSYIEYGYLQAVELLAEDLTDGKLLIHAVDHYQKINGYRSLSYKIIPRNGGGANIADNLLSSLESGKDFTIVFCDSDRFSPDANLGEVTQRCKDLSESNVGLSIFFSTSGREIENDLPLNFITESHIEDPNVLRRIEKLEKLTEKLDIPFMKYMDLKEGLKSEWFYKFVESSENFKFWNQVISVLPKLDPASFPEDISKNKPEIILPMIASKMASNTLDWLDNNKKNHPKSIHTSITNDIKAKSWLTHGENIFWLGCAMKKIRL